MITQTIEPFFLESFGMNVVTMLILLVSWNIITVLLASIPSYDCAILETGELVLNTSS